MANFLKRTLTVFIMLAMVASLAACGGSGKKTEASASTQSASTTQASSQEKVKEPVTLTIFGGETEKTFPTGVQDDPVAKDIQQKLGITIDIRDQSTTPDKIKILVASGDLPDLVEADTTNLLTLAGNGQIIELDNLLESNGADIKANAKTAVAYAKKFMSNGTGKLYFIPGQISPDGQVLNLVAPYIRWDYYAELGYPAVKNYDDLLNVVAEILKKHPTNESGQKMFGFSPWFDWDTFAFGMFTGYMSGIQQFEAGLGWDMFNKKLINWVDDTNSFMWQGVKFWNKANRMGLLDRDALTQKYDQAIQKGGQNRIICEITQWQQGNTNNDLEKAGFKGKGIEPLPPFEGTDGYVGGWKGMIGNNGRTWAISKNCKNPDRAMELINYMFSVEGCLTMYNGVKGESWTEENGKYKLSDKFLEARKNDPNFVLTTGARKYNTWPGLDATFKLPSGQTLELLKDKPIEQETYTQVDKDYIQHYGIDVKGDIVGKFAKRYMSEELVTKFTTPVPPDDIKSGNEKLKAYYIKELPKMVLAKSDDQLNAMIKKLQDELKNMGLQTVQQWYFDHFKKATDTEKEFLSSIGN